MSKLIIEREAWDKIRGFVDNCRDEISGLGKVTARGYDFVVSDVAIFTQEVSDAHSNITGEALALFQTERVKAGESMKKWRLWWHSHAAMQVFFSGTDTNTIDSTTEFPWLVSLVTNHRHDLKARLDVYEPIHLTLENLPVEIIRDAVNPFEELCKSEIAAKVSRRVEAWGKTTRMAGFRDYREYPESREEYWAEKKRLQNKIKELRKMKQWKHLQEAETELEEVKVEGVVMGWDVDPTIRDSELFSTPQNTKRDTLQLLD